MMRRFKSSVSAQQARSKSTCAISLTLGTLLIALPSLHVELIHYLKFRYWALPALSRELIPVPGDKFIAETRQLTSELRSKRCARMSRDLTSGLRSRRAPDRIYTLELGPPK
ncbi:hypothetical protein P692DRAFT_20826491 [Suillus brevipes Sb2]|nr:hypothetical protein P692DRAFT_20826491 [Suillus brevipes Sb2]